MKRLGALGLIAAFGVVVPCVAQVAPSKPKSTAIAGVSADTKIDAPRGQKTKPGEEAATDRNLRVAVQCFVDQQKARSVRLVQSIPGSDDEAMLVRTMRDPLVECMPGDNGGVAYPDLILRGVVAEVLYRRDFAASFATTPRRMRSG